MRTAIRAALLFLLASGCAIDKEPSLGTSRHASPLYAPGWSAAHGDSANSDYSPTYGATDLTLAWRREFVDGTINLGPTNDGAGRVYVTTSAPGCHLYALNQYTGETIWCSEELNRWAVSSSALLGAEGRIFVSDNKAMFAFNTDGQVLWRTPIKGFTLSAQFTPSGHIVFVTHIGRIYVLDRRTGDHILDPVDLIPGGVYDPDSPRQPALACMLGTRNCPAANTIAVDQKTGRFFFTFFAPGAEEAGLRGMQYVEDPAPSIKPLWVNDALPGGSGSSPVLSVDGSRLYVNDNIDSIHTIDALTGETIWRVPIGWASKGSPSVSPEGLIIPTGGGPLLAIADTGSEGRLLWRRGDIDNRSIATQAAGGVAYPVVASGDRSLELLIIDTATGVTLDREILPGENRFTVGTTISPDGMIFTPTFDGKLFAFRKEACEAAP